MITNTRSLAATRAGAFLNILPGAIEASEAQGQRELVNSTQLPTDMDAKCRAALEAAGVKFGPASPGDPMFCSAELPAGWQKKATDHAMYSDLVDEKGSAVAAIFYKAAFYDRSAHMYLKS